MTKDKHYFGIDISKDVFDVCDNNKVHYQFKNSISGFKKLIKLGSREANISERIRSEMFEHNGI